MADLLVLAETDGAHVQPATLAAITFAQQFVAAGGSAFDVLVAGGPGVGESAAGLARYGARAILVAEDDRLSAPMADTFAAMSATVVRDRGAAGVAGTATSFGRDILPRVAATLDFPMLSDILACAWPAGRIECRRPMYAGNLIATVEVDGSNAVYSVRGAAYGAPTATDTASEVVSYGVPANSVASGCVRIDLDAARGSRPDLGQARRIVSGGRPLRDAATFEAVIGGLADALGGSVGATRAAVDSGIAPNELQIGQTGKVVAPDLYIAAGVSGSIQHLAGMKDSKVIVAINNDPNAPIFGVADYGLVADLFEAVPELTRKLAAS